MRVLRKKAPFLKGKYMLFSRFGNAFYRFMQDRRGFDSLGGAILILAAILSIVFRFTRHIACWIVMALFMLWFLWRFFSHRIDRRAKENEWFLARTRRVRAWFRLQKNRVRDRKTHRFYRCPGCRNTVRVPKGRGKIRITCPICREIFVRKS